MNVNEQDLGTTVAFIDLWNVLIQVKGCHEGTQLFPKDMPFGSKLTV